MPLNLRSTAFAAGAAIPRRHSGEGEDLSPPLAWSDVPSEARELALVVDDPDAPSPHPWVHWVIYHIGPGEDGVAEGVHPNPKPPYPPGAAQGKNSWGTLGYRGPMPPRGHGVHRYFFRLYALGTKLKLAPGLDRPALLRAIQGHILAEVELMGTYERR